MQEIKLVEQTNNKQGDTQTQFFLDQQAVPQKRKIQDNLDTLEPWMEDTDNPFLHFKSKQVKRKESPPSLRRQKSTALAKSWKSIQKPCSNRQSKILPVMDVGHLNSIRKAASYSTAKIKNKIDFSHPQSPSKSTQKRPQTNSVALPAVKRELLVERKIFLMKQQKENKSSLSSSPIKSSRIRSIISQARP